ncbi:MAG: sulfatase-like hydrolase/transferase [Legionella sp.]
MLIILCISGFSLLLLILNSLLYRQSIYILLALSPFLLYFIFSNFQNKTNIPLASTKPNIILLGIDSLSVESVTRENMPFLSQLIKNSSQFTNAVSPLARTYPAWTSILTGLYAEHHGAAENLVAKDIVKSQNSIAWTLANQGYTTIFTSDDRRFNSIGHEFGFKYVIGPKLGVNDVLLGTFNDFPLSNLLINFRFSSWLFPFNYSNRASYFSYYPQTFNRKLENALNAEVRQFPIFLAVHFTLPHWPYAWAESSATQLNNEFSIERRNSLYQQSLRQVDQQFASFFTYLEQNHYFENTLLILLSDHGEVLYYPNSRLTNYENYQGKPPSRFAEYLKHKTATELNKSAGHGSDILSPKQYHSVLAFRIYKNGQMVNKPQTIDVRVALIDLAPTILEFLHMTIPQKMDGISLLHAMVAPLVQLPQRIFYIESGMFPNQLLSKQKSIAIGELYYNVNPLNGELEIKPAMMKAISEQKIYGIISGDWILALYPDKKTYIPVIQNLHTDRWSDNLHSDFAKSAPVKKMYQQMQHFYGKELFLPVP